MLQNDSHLNCLCVMARLIEALAICIRPSLYYVHACCITRHISACYILVCSCQYCSGPNRYTRSILILHALYVLHVLYACCVNSKLTMCQHAVFYLCCLLPPHTKLKEVMFSLCVSFCQSVRNQDNLICCQWIFTKLAVNDHHENISLEFDFDGIL